MSVIRQDMFTGEWIIYAANRKKRPYDFVKRNVARSDNYKNCPFCSGNEEKTPKAVYQNGTDWNIRVFPNMYPAVGGEMESFDTENFYHSISGTGIHEVLVDTPEHESVIHNFSTQHIEEILKVLQKRYIEIKKQIDVQYIQIFKNCGPEAGMSLIHSHWQIMGVPFLPNHQKQAQLISKSYYQKNKNCLFCHMLAHEKNVNKRIIAENEKFLLFTPYAPKISYEIWIAPKEHICCYSDFNDTDLAYLSKILKNALTRVAQIREGISYNICFIDMPKTQAEEKYCHWYLKIYPRMGSFAGFEFATGSYINPVLPEVSAKHYRDLDFNE